MKSASQPFRIALLICDHVSQELSPRHDSYSTMLQALLQMGDTPLDITVYDLLSGEKPNAVHDHDGYITSGSRYSVNDSDPWIRVLSKIMQECIQASIPIVGICFGHQLLAKVLGGEVNESHKGWGIGATQYQFEVNTPLWANTPDPPSQNLKLCISHKEQITRLPTNSKVLGGNAFCPNAVVLFNQTALGIQGHPEFSIEYSKDLMHLRQDLYPKNTYESALQSLYDGIDQRLWARWIMGFFRSSTHALG